MMSVPKNQFMTIFNDPTFAWELLQWQIAIEMNDALSGQAIAKLLQLYMRGVEKMNSVMDIRESYFKNKVTSLMTKTTVVKTLSKPPMAKKQKPLQIIAKMDNKKVEQANVVKQPSKVEEAPSKPTVSAYSLQQKKKQIQMRLAYEAQENTRQSLSNMLHQHIKKQQNLQSKIKNIIDNHEQKLRQRINRRKLKTATYRSRPEDTNDTSSKQMDIDLMQEGKKLVQDNFNSTSAQNLPEDGLMKKDKRFRSLQNKVEHDLVIQQSPKRARKLTFDSTPGDTPLFLKNLNLIQK